MAEFRKYIIAVLIIFSLNAGSLYASSAPPIVIKPEGCNQHNNIAMIRISPGSMILYRGGCMQFIVSAFDSKGRKVPFNMHWEVESEIPGFGSLDKSEGDRVIFNAENAGTGSLIAINGDIRAAIPVEIRKPGR